VNSHDRFRSTSPDETRSIISLHEQNNSIKDHITCKITIDSDTYLCANIRECRQQSIFPIDQSYKRQQIAMGIRLSQSLFRQKDQFKGTALHNQQCVASRQLHNASDASASFCSSKTISNIFFYFLFLRAEVYVMNNKSLRHSPKLADELLQRRVSDCYVILS